jgi:hypothetical protein
MSPCLHYHYILLVNHLNNPPRCTLIMAFFLSVGLLTAGEETGFRYDVKHVVGLIQG